MDYDDFCLDLDRHRGGGRRGLAVFRTIHSSHALGRRLLEEYTHEGNAVPALDLVAWYQSGGQGREQRPWSSPAGAGAYVTLVRSTPLPALQLLPLLVSVALASTLNEVLGGRVGLKWPNDLLVDGKKLGGILLETVSRGPDTGGVVVSFGVNHAADLSIFEQPGATSVLAELSREAGQLQEDHAAGALGPPTLSRLVVLLAEAVDDCLSPAQEAEVVLREYRRLSVHRPAELLAVRSQEEIVVGSFLGFDDNGFLRLEIEGAERRFSVGELAGASDSDGATT